MKKVFLLSLVLLLLTGNLFAQTNFNPAQDSSLNKPKHLTSTVNGNLKKLSSSKGSSENVSGTVAGALAGAAGGVLIGAFLGGLSMEPSSDKKASVGSLILFGAFGAVIGAMVGGMASE